MIEGLTEETVSTLDIHEYKKLEDARIMISEFIESIAMKNKKKVQRKASKKH